MKCLQGAMLTTIGTLLIASVATAQYQPAPGSQIPPQVTYTNAYGAPGAVSHDWYGGYCGGGCCPSDNCCNPCQKHGLAVLWERMKAKMCDRKRCRKGCCQTTCCEPACQAVTTCCAEPTCHAEPACHVEPHCSVVDCCPQKTCCPHPISCAPELGSCCGPKKGFSLRNLFKRKCCDRGCCSLCSDCGYPPTSYRGGYPVYPEGHSAPANGYQGAPRQNELTPPSPPRPTVEQTSNERRYVPHGAAAPPARVPNPSTRRGPI